VGHQTETINDSLELVARGGTVLAFGVPDKSIYPIEYETFFRKNARLQAVVTPVWADALPKALDLFLAHQSLLETLFTHCYGISQAGRAFEAYETQRDGLLKVLLNAACWGEDCE
jgi:threonine dehydrogenase-like Zn-dependent dehydrogenase